MATKDFVRFRSEYLPQHPNLQKKLDALTDERERVKAMVAAGHEAGFTFNAAEVEAGLKTSERKIREADVELTDAQLGSVAGFLALQEATQMESRKFFLALQEATQMESRSSFWRFKRPPRWNRESCGRAKSGASLCPTKRSSSTAVA